MAINKHGLKMIGIKAAAAETNGLNPYDHGYVQISYDTETGDILTNYHYSIGQNSWTQYDDSNIITVCYTHSKMTMQEIADAIANAMQTLKAHTQL